MKLYNININKIENIKYFSNNGIQYVDKLSSEELNSFGYYKLEYLPKPNRRYYTVIEVKEIINNIYTISYTAIEKPLNIVIALMSKDLRETYKNLLDYPRVDSTLGYDIFASLDSIEELRLWKDYAFTEIFDADGVIQTVNGESYTTFSEVIKTYRRGIFDIAKIKTSEVANMADINACILYEATPFDCPEYDIDGNLTGETIICYKNNVKEW